VSDAEAARLPLHHQRRRQLPRVCVERVLPCKSATTPPSSCKKSSSAGQPARPSFFDSWTLEKWRDAWRDLVTEVASTKRARAAASSCRSRLSDAPVRRRRASVSLFDWLLPAEGRLSTDDVQALSRVAALVPKSWNLGLLAPSRGERRALPRYEAVAVVADGAALRPPALRRPVCVVTRRLRFGSGARVSHRAPLLPHPRRARASETGGRGQRLLGKSRPQAAFYGSIAGTSRPTAAHRRLPTGVRPSCKT